MEKGKPLYRIDWKEVGRLLMQGASGVQIAAVIGIHPETLYDRCRSELGRPFTEFSLEKREKGNSALLGMQYKEAEKGSVAMLIWLGKQRLGQKEPKDKDNETDLLLKLVRCAIIDGTLEDLSKQLQIETK